MSPNSTPLTTQVSLPFPAPEAIWDYHNILIEKLECEEDQTKQLPCDFIQLIHSFMAQVKLTGKVLEGPKERSSIQGLLNYWSTVLYSHNQQPISATLAKFERKTLKQLIAQKDEFYTQLTDLEQVISKQILVQLIQLVGQGKIQRIPRQQQALSIAEQNQEVVDRVLHQLEQQELIWRSSGETENGRTLYFSYESLAHHWQRLKDWLEQDQRRSEARRQLTEAAKHWDIEGRRIELLWRGEPLRRVVGFKGLDALEQDFIQQSQHVENTTLIVENTTLIKKNQQLKNRLILSFVLLCLALIAGGIARLQWREAEQARMQAVSLATLLQRIFLTGSFSERAKESKVLLTWTLSATYQVKQASHSGVPKIVLDSLESKLRQSLEPVLLAKLEPNPEWLISEGGSIGPGASSAQVIYTVDNQYAIATVIPNQKQLSKRRIIVWRLKEGYLTQLYSSKDGEFPEIIGAELSIDGQWLFTSTKNTQWQIWQFKDNSLIPLNPADSKLNKGYPTDIKFSEDKKWLAYGSTDGAVYLWKLTDTSQKEQPIFMLFGHHEKYDYVTSIAFSDDNQRLVSTYADGAIRLWNLEDMSPQPKSKSEAYYKVSPRLKQSKKNPDGYILSVKFASDDSIITTSLSGSVLRWDLDTWTSRKDETALLKSEDFNRLNPLIQLACDYLQTTNALVSPETNAENAKKLCASQNQLSAPASF